MPAPRRDIDTGELVHPGTVEYLHVAVRDLEDLVNELRRWRDEVDDRLANIESRLNDAITDASERMEMLEQRYDARQ